MEQKINKSIPSSIFYSFPRNKTISTLAVNVIIKLANLDI